MGDLIFLRKAEQKSARQNEPSIIPLLDSVGNILQSSDVTTDLELSFLKIECYLKSLRNKPSTHSIAIARDLFQSYTDDDLEITARTCTPQQWGVRPGYFQALIDEHRARQHRSPRVR